MSEAVPWSSLDFYLNNLYFANKSYVVTRELDFAVIGDSVITPSGSCPTSLEVVCTVSFHEPKIVNRDGVDVEVLVFSASKEVKVSYFSPDGKIIGPHIRVDEFYDLFEAVARTYGASYRTTVFGPSGDLAPEHVSKFKAVKKATSIENYERWPKPKGRKR